MSIPLRVAYLEYINPDENSEKFYLVAYNAAWTTTAYGRIGSKGQILTKQQSGSKKVSEKENKGYALRFDKWVDIPDSLSDHIGSNDGSPVIRWILDKIESGQPADEWNSPDSPDIEPSEEGDAIAQLSERALKAIELAAESPQQAIVAYAQLTADLEEEVDRLAVVQSHVNTLEVMLGMDTQQGVA